VVRLGKVSDRSCRSGSCRLQLGNRKVCGFRFNFGRIAEATGSEVCGRVVGCAGSTAVRSRSVVFSASSAWVFLAS
jgi:hypothetical protein